MGQRGVRRVDGRRRCLAGRRARARALRTARRHVRAVRRHARPGHGPRWRCAAWRAPLRAPGFGCRDDELLEFAHAGGRWDYRRGAPATLGADHRVVTALAALRALHERRWWESVSATVDRVVRERRLLELAVAHRRPRDHWRRIRFVADTARAFVERGGTSLREFVGWVRNQIEEEARA